MFSACRTNLFDLSTKILKNSTKITSGNGLIILGSQKRFGSTHSELLGKALGEKLFFEEEKVPIESIDEVYAQPKRLEPTHGIPVCQVQLRSYSLHRLDFYVEFIQKVAYTMKMPCSGTVFLPTRKQRWAVLKSPFVHKSAMEIFERRTHKRLIQIRDASPESVEAFLKYVEENVPAGVGMKSKTFEYEQVGYGKSVSVDKAEMEKLDEIAAKLPPTPRDIKSMAELVAAELAKNPKANIENITKEIISKARSLPK
ncbi:hypothetical protein BB559_003894 [Furculomyces boomerangus]|uniref:Small ribosomal subunit protein uS10m n=1 Tax=Furculomyces boomerangus TaxID=61424 RepID=A0A2T9YI06_9FUNG|nr:hypothetical protein BB559_003894 [Furculomyces boomerangus]